MENNDAANALARKLRSLESFKVDYVNVKGLLAQELWENAQRITQHGGTIFRKVYQGITASKLNAPDKKYLTANGFYARSVAEDGNCMYRAVADQLFNDETRHLEVRAAMFPRIQKEFNDSEDCHQHPNCWGNNATLHAISDAYSLHIVVYNKLDGRISKMQDMIGSQHARTVNLFLIDDRHYWSLRPVSEMTPKQPPEELIPTPPRQLVRSPAPLDSATTLQGRAAKRLANEKLRLPDGFSLTREDGPVWVVSVDRALFSATIAHEMEAKQISTVDFMVVVTNEYPFKPPRVGLLAPHFTTNPDREPTRYLSPLFKTDSALQMVSVPIQQWSPALTVAKLITLIVSELNDPTANAHVVWGGI